MEQNKTIIKRDTFENWAKATKYIPIVGTIIVVDMPDNSVQLKIGDGKTLVNNLPNILQSNTTIENNTLVLGRL